jgi:hypothetical protein
MATDIAGLFGITPQGLSQQRYQQDLKQGYELAQLDPGAAARATLQSGVGQLGRGIAGMMGVEDPQMKLISARQSVIGQLDQTDPASLLKGAQMLTQMGDQQGAFALADYARKAQVQIAEQQQRLAMGQASLMAASRERLQADPEKVRLAKAVAATKGAEGSPEYVTAYNESLEKQMTPTDKPDAKPNIQKLQEYAATLQPGSPLLAQVQAAIKAESQSRGVTVNLPSQEKAFEGGLGAGQSKKILEDKTSALDAAAILETNQVAKDLLKSGVITGTGANFFVGLNSALQQAGLDFGYADAASNSQAYVSAMGANVGRLIKQFGAGTGLSNADREYAEKMAGGQITLTESALRKIIDINDRAANRVIDLHNRNVKDIKTNIPLTVEKPTRTQPARTAVEQIPTQQGANMTPMYARNPETNQRIMSTDGGKTWQPAR